MSKLLIEIVVLNYRLEDKHNRITSQSVTAFIIYLVKSFVPMLFLQSYHGVKLNTSKNIRYQSPFGTI